MKTSQSTVQEILSQKTLAIVGVSRSGKKFGNAVLRELKGKGYTVYPVHPQADVMDGQRCYPDLKSLPEKPGALVICVPPLQAEQVVQQAFEAGIMRVWFQQGAQSYSAVRYCENHDMTAVHGHCILMFAEPVGSMHGVHRWIWKLIGKYPPASHEHFS